MLGLDVSDAAGRLAVHIGATRLVFEPGRSSPQHFAIRIPSAAYADALGWLAERVELLTDDGGGRAFAFPDWNADAAYFRDPDRNVVELIAHHDLPEPYRPPFGRARCSASARWASRWTTSASTWSRSSADGCAAAGAVTG